MRGMLAAAFAMVAAGCARSSGDADARAEAAAARDISVCVIEGGELRLVSAVHDTLTGDTLVDGRPLAEAHPAAHPPYARDAPWLAKEIIVLEGKYFYAAYGPPRVLEPGLLARAGEFRGVPLFAERGTIQDSVPGAGTLYVPVRPGCEFQPYLANVDIIVHRPPARPASSSHAEFVSEFSHAE